MQFFWGQTSFRKILGQLPSSRSTSVPRKNPLLPHGQWEKSLLSAQPSVSCPINSIQSLIFKFLNHMSNSISTIPKLQGNMSSSVSGFLEVPSFLWLKEGGEYGSPPHIPIVTQLLTERTGIQEPWALVWVLILTHCVSLGNILFHFGPCFPDSWLKWRCRTRFTHLFSKCLSSPCYVSGTVWVWGIIRKQTSWLLRPYQPSHSLMLGANNEWSSSGCNHDYFPTSAVYGLLL